jgi:histidinol-phosphate aminotransferase
MLRHYNEKSDRSLRDVIAKNMAHTIEELIPEYIRGLPVYIPGRPIEEVEREMKIHAIKMASNENPLGPSPKAVEAVPRKI